MASSKNRLLTACTIFGLGLGIVSPGLRAAPGTVAVSDATSAEGGFFESQIDPGAEGNFSLALFRLWLPPTKAPVAGVLAVFPVSDMNGIPLVDDPQWQAVARTWNYALLAGTFTTSGRGLPYYRAEAGSGQALVAALEQMGAASGHAELREVPLAMLGHSQGGQFALHFACWKPARVIACATIKGGFYNVEPSAAARAVPALLIAGKEDSKFRQTKIRELFDRTSAGTARWAFALEPKSGHELGRSLQLVLPFFGEVIRGELQPYSGDLDDFTIRPASVPPEPGRAWLPSQRVAEVWSRYSAGTLQEPTPELAIPGEPFPPAAQAAIRSQDFGSIELQREFPAAQFHFRPLPKGRSWNAIQAYSGRSRCEVSVSSSKDDWIVSVKPLVGSLPLGRLNDTIYVRYLMDGKPVLGGSEVEVTFNHIHPDLKLSANGFYVGVHTQPCQKEIELSSPNGKPLKIRSVEMVSGTGAAFSIRQESATVVKVVGDFAALPEAGNHSGIIALHLDEPVRTTVMMPFIGHFLGVAP